MGAQLVPHKNSHSYRVVDSLSFPVYTLDWGADEETLLLEAVEHYGLGHWVQIGQHVGKSAEECKAHFFKVYVEAKSFPRPEKSEEMQSLNIEKDIRRIIEEKRVAGAKRIAASYQSSGPMDKTPKATLMGSQANGSVKVKVEDIVKKEEKSTEQQGQKKPSAKTTPEATGVKDEGSIVPSSTAPLASQSGPLVSPAEGGAPVALIESQQSGYHIKRNEFEVEYDHEAEHLIAELEFIEDEPAESVAEKLKMISIYNRRLDERERRREFVLTRGLVKIKRQQLIDKRRVQAEKSLLGRLRVFARYIPQPQWESLADGLAVEGRLRARLDELKKYREMGLRTFEEVDLHMQQQGPPKKEPSINNHPGRSKLQRILVDNCALEVELGKMGIKPASDAVHEYHSMIPEGRGIDGLAAWRAKRGILMDLTSLPDVAPLTQSERRLCATERYLPAQYLAIKAEIMKKQEKNGHVSKNDILSLPYAVDMERSLRLLDFFKQHGWIKLGRAHKSSMS